MAPSPAVQILRRAVVTFAYVLSAGLSRDWSDGVAWAAYVGGIAPDASVYGPTRARSFVQINHCSTHTLFRSVFDQFLKVFARVVSEANAALDRHADESRDKHEPHYALYLAFLRASRVCARLRQHADAAAPRFLLPDHSRPQGKARRAGPCCIFWPNSPNRPTAATSSPASCSRPARTIRGKDAFFANVNDFVANQAQGRSAEDRLSARRASRSARARCTTRPHLRIARRQFGRRPRRAADLGRPSWHPFFNKIYVDGALSEIRMPEARYRLRDRLALSADGRRHAQITVLLTINGCSARASCKTVHRRRPLLPDDGQRVAGRRLAAVRSGRDQPS